MNKQMTPEEIEKARERMVKTQLVATGVEKYEIIENMGDIPRENFVTEEFKIIAYSAKEIPITKTRYLLDPMSLGLLLDKVDFSCVKKAMVIADGSGYVTTLLSDIVQQVVTIDSVEKFKETIDVLSLDNVTAVEGDITQGYAQGGPYDLIYINGAIQDIGSAIPSQLSKEGKILTTLKKAFISQGVFMFNGEGGKLQTEKLFECSVSLLPEFKKASKFNF